MAARRSPRHSEATKTKLSQKAKAAWKRRKQSQEPEPFDLTVDEAAIPGHVVIEGGSGEPNQIRLSRENEVREFPSLWRRTPARLLGRR